MRDRIRGLVAIAVVLGAALLATSACGDRGRATAPELSTQYQAVLLVNGQAYFGKIEKLGSPYVVLRDVHYVQSRVDPQTKATSNVLVKRGKEWHGPDRMILNAEHILLIEPVGPDSTVAKLIEELRKQQ